MIVVIMVIMIQRNHREPSLVYQCDVFYPFYVFMSNLCAGIGQHRFLALASTENLLGPRCSLLIKICTKFLRVSQFLFQNHPT